MKHLTPLDVLIYYGAARWHQGLFVDCSRQACEHCEVLSISAL